MICSNHLKKIHPSKGLAFEKHLVFFCFVFWWWLHALNLLFRKVLKQKSCFLAKGLLWLLKKNFLVFMVLACVMTLLVNPVFISKNPSLLILFSLILKSLFYNQVQYFMSPNIRCLLTTRFCSLLIWKKSHVFVCFVFWFCWFLICKILLPIVV